MARDLNRELLAYVGFEGEELEEFLPKWEYTAKVCKLGDKEIAYALDTYIPQNFDVKYMGLRKVIGAYLRELVDLTHTPFMKEKGTKILYGILPANVSHYYAIKLAGGDDVFVGFPDIMMVTVLNSFFHNAAPFLNEAENYGLSYGSRHCPLNKMRLAAYVTGAVASPDLIWSWGFNCDEGPKTDELIQNILGDEWKYHVTRVPHDTHTGDYEDLLDERVTYMAEQMKAGIAVVEKELGIKVTSEHMAAANKEIGRISFKLGMLQKMVGEANPPVINGESLALLGSFANKPFNTGYKYMEEAFDLLNQELKDAIKAGEGIMPKDTPKIGLYSVSYTIPWIGKFFRDNGVLCAFSAIGSFTKHQMRPTRFPDDPWKAAAESWAKMGISRNLLGEADDIAEKLMNNNADGVLFGLFDFDRWQGAQQKLISKYIEEKTGIPCYYLEGDFWDDREYSEEVLKTRIESLAQIINTRKARKLAGMN